MKKSVIKIVTALMFCLASSLQDLLNEVGHKYIAQLVSLILCVFGVLLMDVYADTKRGGGTE